MHAAQAFRSRASHDRHVSSRRAFLLQSASATGAVLAGAARLHGAAADLVAGMATAVVWPPAPTPVWTFGGTYPAPTLRVRSGERIDLTLRNDLPAPTNVHWHGLAVPADMDGHPADVVARGGSRHYGFRVDARAGTYWYHPHPHGQTAAQVYAGMAGFLIVEDEEERALGLPSGVHDVPLLLQDRRLRADRSFAYEPTLMDRMSGLLGDVAVANGLADLRLPVEAALYRLRLLNGCNARVLRVAFADGRRFLVVGTDGGLLAEAVSATSVDMGPGERVDVVVDLGGEAPGRSVSLVSLPFAAGGGMGMGSAQGAPLRLATLDVARPASARTALPGRLATLARLDGARARRTRTFDLTMGMMGTSAAINGRTFAADRVDVTVPMGDVEVWEVRNLTGEPHPFHVHATSFQVLDRSTARTLPPQDLGWKDTVLLWPGERVRIVLQFTAHRGLYVAHCHNLEHEDAGMVMNVLVD